MQITVCIKYPPFIPVAKYYGIKLCGKIGESIFKQLYYQRAQLSGNAR